MSWKKRLVFLCLAVAMAASMAACGGTDDSQQDTNEPQQNNADQTKPTTDDNATDPTDETEVLEAAEIQVFIAASLDNAFQQIIQLYNETQRRWIRWRQTAWPWAAHGWICCKMKWS